jgi:hypothetical protein
MAKQYKLMFDGQVCHVAGPTWFTPGSNNLSDQTYQAWLADGNTPDPADPIPTPVRYVSKYLIDQRLIAAGKMDAALLAWQSLPEIQQRLWMDAQDIDASNSDIRAFLTALELNPDEILA